MSEKHTIMVVEDERPLLEAVKRKLEMNNFEVLSARSVEQAMNNMTDVPNIEVIWLDHYLLGTEDGLDFVAKLKGNEKWKTIPIFVVSNTATDEKVKTYLRLGVEKYYTKSDYRLDQIIEDIEQFIKTQE